MPQTVIRSVAMSTDTNAYGAGDLLADTQELADAVKVNDAGGIIESMTIIDGADNGSILDVYILSSNISMGTENSAPNISDANAKSAILGKISLVAADYADIGGSKVATKSNLGLPIKPVSGGTSIYVAIVNGSGTPTFGAADITLTFGIVQG